MKIQTLVGIHPLTNTIQPLGLHLALLMQLLLTISMNGVRAEFGIHKMDTVRITIPQNPMTQETYIGTLRLVTIRIGLHTTVLVTIPLAVHLVTNH